MLGGGVEWNFGPKLLDIDFLGLSFRLYWISWFVFRIVGLEGLKFWNRIREK
jgi:hypothetical protein